MALYKNVLHHRDNILPKWFLEMLGVYVSLLNRCSYCVDHHSAGLKRLLNDDDRSIAVMEAIRSQNFAAFTNREQRLLEYARRLTLNPETLDDGFIEKLRRAKLVDAEILEAKQVISYFAYANRVVLGLGVTTESDELGLSPGSDEEGDWGHQ